MAVLDLSAVGFSLAAVSGGCSIAVASHWGGFSCWGAQTLRRMGFSCGSQSPGHRLSTCEVWASLLHSMCDLAGSGIVLTSPALGGGFFTIEPPGKPKKCFCSIKNLVTGNIFIWGNISKSVLQLVSDIARQQTLGLLMHVHWSPVVISRWQERRCLKPTPSSKRQLENQEKMQTTLMKCLKAINHMNQSHVCIWLLGFKKLKKSESIPLTTDFKILAQRQN